MAQTLRNQFGELSKKVFGLMLKYEIYRILKETSFFTKIKIMIRKKRSIGYRIVLHGDQILWRAFKIFGQHSKITSIIETGTFFGNSTKFMAKTFPQLQINTCEINKVYYIKAKKNLKKCKNVKIYLKSSPDFLNSITKNLLGKIPLFYLDAHWGNDWPLEREIKIISEKIKSAIIIIDDFKIPGDNRFGFDGYKDKECSLDLIIPHLNKKNKYHLLLPNYGEKEAFKKGIIHSNLCGYPIIFQNLQSQFKKISKHPFIKKYFIDRSDLIRF